MQPARPEIPWRYTRIAIQLQALRVAQESRVAVIEILRQLIIRSESYGEFNRYFEFSQYDEFINAEGVQIVLTVKKRYLRRVNIQQQALRVLAELVESIPAFNTLTLEAMANAFASVVLSTMRLHERRASIQELGCRILAALAEKLRLNRDSTWVIDNVDTTVIGTILDGLRSHEDVASVQDEGCRLLDVLASNDDISHSIGVGGGIEIVLAALRNHHANNHTCGLGYFALANLAKNNDNKEVIRSAGGVEFVLSDMQNDTFKLGIVCTLLVVLGERDDMAALIEASDGFQLIWSEICRAPKIDPKGILGLSFSRQGNAISRRLVQAGVLDFILSSIHNTDYPNEFHLIRSLATLATNDETARRIDEQGDVGAILEILDGNCDYQYLFYYLSRNDEIANMIVYARAIEKLLEKERDVVRERMSWECAKRMVVAGGIEFLLSILQNSQIGDILPILHLVHFGRIDAHANRIINAGVIEMILSRIQDADDINKSKLIESLGHVAWNVIIATKIVEEGGVRVILSCIQNAEEINKSELIGSLGSVAANYIIATGIVEGGGLQVILSSIQNAEEINKSKLMRSLGSVAENDIIATKIVERGGVQVILSSIHNAEEINKSKLIDSLGRVARNPIIAGSTVAANGMNVILGCIQNADESNKSMLIKSLKSLVRNNILRTGIIASSGCEIILACIQNADNSYKSSLIESLGFIAWNDEIASAIVAANGITTILDCIQNAEVINKPKLIEILGQITVNDSIATRIVAANGIQIILTCLQNADDIEKPEQIESLVRLAANDTIATSILEANGMEVIWACFQNADSINKCKFIESLGCMAANGVFASAIFKANGIDVILSFIRHEEDFNRFKFHLILGCCARNNKVSTRIKAAMCMLSILQKAHNSYVIQYLSRLAEKDKIAMEIVAANGIEIILSVIHNVRVFDDKIKAIETLTSLARTSNEIATRIAAARGTGRILSCFEGEHDFDKIFLIRTFMSLARTNGEITTMNLSVESVQALLWLIQRAANPGDDKIEAIKAMEILSYFARNDIIANCIIAAGDIEIILRAMQLHQDSYRFQECGCRLLGKLVLNEATTALIVNMKGVHIIVSAIVRFGKSDMQESGCDVLRALVHNDDNVKSMIRSTIMDECDRLAAEWHMTRQDAEDRTEVMIQLVLGTLGHDGV